MALVHAINTIILLAGLAGLTVLVLYLWSFAIVFLITSKRATPVADEPHSRFVFVVPAHNEESGITATVLSLLSVHYPRQLFDVVVVADNCTDATAERAREAGAECIVRHDSALRGKGYALRHAFDILTPKGYDAFIVIDADSIVSENFLSALDTRLGKGEKVVQAYDGLSNPDASILTYLFQVGNLIENRLFWEPKERLGRPVMLRGNGMCFTREILEKFPWDSFSIVEDTEYGLMLLEQGIRIRFAPEIGVFAHQPENLQQAYIQRVRWASGNATLTKSRALSLVARGISGRDLLQFEVGLSLFAGSRPLLLVGNLLLAVFALIIGNVIALSWAAALLLGQMLYICLGITMNGISVLKMSRLFLSPFYLAWLCGVSVLGLAGYKKNQWLRTSRT